MSLPDLNCLRANESLDAFVREFGVTTYAVGYSRDTSTDPGETRFENCAPKDATIATLFAICNDGEALPIHDAEPGEAGARELGLIAGELLRIIVMQTGAGPVAVKGMIH